MSALYVQIASEIRELIKKGILPIHGELSERKLAERYSTGRSTIAAALRLLKEEGYVESEPKSGTKVRKRQPEASACWERFLRTGISAASNLQTINAMKYMTFSGKEGLTFGMGSEFEPYEPHRMAFESLALRKDLDRDMNLFDARGIPAVRRSIAEHLLTSGIEVSPDNIITFNSYLEGVYAVAMALLNQGTNLYCIQGDMIKRMATIRSTGANYHEIPVDAEGPVISEFERMLRPSQMNMFYINPVNCYPIGLTYSDGRMDELMKVCEKYNVAVLENDFLRDIWAPRRCPSRRGTESALFT